LIVVTAAVIEKDAKILAARRGRGKHLAGFWEFPGGKLEAGETPEQCLARELAEEFGIESRVGEFIGESVFDYGEKIIRLIAYQVVHLAGEFQLEDHDEIRWLSLNELEDILWAPADIPLLEPVKKLLKD
jgi:8-oxo-dGTP diphosphatase